MFYDDGTLIHKWQAHPDAVNVSAQTDSELTARYQVTVFCAEPLLCVFSVATDRVTAVSPRGGS